MVRAHFLTPGSNIHDRNTGFLAAIERAYPAESLRSTPTQSSRRVTAMADDVEQDKLLSRDEAADLLGVSKGTLEVWACTDRYDLPFVKIGRLAKYRRADLNKFIKDRTVVPTPKKDPEKRYGEKGEPQDASQVSRRLPRFPKPHRD
jgi:excisionase family DNA binding protein